MVKAWKRTPRGRSALLSSVTSSIGGLRYKIIQNICRYKIMTMILIAWWKTEDWCYGFFDTYKKPKTIHGSSFYPATQILATYSNMITTWWALHYLTRNFRRKSTSSRVWANVTVLNWTSRLPWIRKSTNNLWNTYISARQRQGECSVNPTWEGYHIITSYMSQNSTQNCITFSIKIKGTNKLCQRREDR